MADDASSRDAWWAAARSSALKRGRLLGVEHRGQLILVGRTRSGAAYALRDVCPHRAARLSAGKVRVEADGRETVECPYHAWRFHTDGACAAIPTLDADSPGAVAQVRVKVYPVVEQQGRVWLWIAVDPRLETAPSESPPLIAGEDRPPLSLLRRLVRRAP